MVIENWSENMQLTLDTINLKAVQGIPSCFLLPMEHSVIEHLAGTEPGSYVKEPEKVYLKMLKEIGTCFVDQFIPKNPLTMGSHGYEDKTQHGATTGAEKIVLDGMEINSPEDTVEHMEKFVFPKIKQNITDFNEKIAVQNIIKKEQDIQKILAPEMLKTGYAFIRFPYFSYSAYGYSNYFMAYALYPEIMEKHFSLQADLAILQNRAAAKAYQQANLPPLYRLDHDMADSRGTLVDIKSLDKIWFPHFARSLEPMLKTNVKMIWHCDGNLMEMVPRLLDVGVSGFQGFQYEDGMDYEKICKMKTKDGNSLFIIGGVSVTTTLPFGKPDDVKKEMQWLVANGPATGLSLAGSSSIAPGTPLENIKTLVEGLQYYKKHGRK